MVDKQMAQVGDPFVKQTGKCPSIFTTPTAFLHTSLLSSLEGAIVAAGICATDSAIASHNDGDVMCVTSKANVLLE